MKNKRKVAQKSDMSTILNQENIQQQPTRKVRQAPGGTSSLVLN
jgi:hypothetical protein